MQGGIVRPGIIAWLPLHCFSQTRTILIRNKVSPGIFLDQLQGKYLERQDLYRQDPKTAPAVPAIRQRNFDDLKDNMTGSIAPDNPSIDPPAGKIKPSPNPAARANTILPQGFSLDGDPFERRI